MTFTPRFPGSGYMQTADGSGNKMYIDGDSVLGLRFVSATSTTLFAVTGQQMTVAENIDVIMEALEPTPTSLPPPPVDVTNGLLRIHPDGGVIARQLPAGNPRGEWQVYVLSDDVSPYYTTNATNPEIATWPFLTVAS